MRPLPTKTLNPKIKNVWRISALVIVALCWLCSALPLLIAGVFDVSACLVLGGVLTALAVLCGVAFCAVLPNIRYIRWRYEVGEHELDITRGIFWRKRFVIPFIRVQNTDTKQGPIMRAFGLAQVTVSTAAGNHEIPGLLVEDADELRDLIAKAKANNMPNDTIDRGIKKAAGEGSAVNYEHITYEGYGPSGTAIIVKTLTDNKNRTAANVRSAFTKGNGSIGTPGCVSFMFDEKGQIIIDKEECDMDADDLMMIALDAGAEDFSDEEDSYEIVTAPDDLVAVADALSENKIAVVSSEVTMLPQTYVDVTDEETVKQIRRILDLLDEDDDVQDVYTNWSGVDDE